MGKWKRFKDIFWAIMCIEIIPSRYRKVWEKQQEEIERLDKRIAELKKKNQP